MIFINQFGVIFLDLKMVRTKIEMKDCYTDISLTARGTSVPNRKVRAQRFEVT